MITVLKRLARYLPVHAQQELKRLWYARQIKKETFESDEVEFFRLERWISAGDWVLDVGANVGHYTVRLSALVGSSGRVLAFEPVTQTFALLSGIVARLGLSNVTLFNVAASAKTGIVGVTIPQLSSGLHNYYMAKVTANMEGELAVLTLPIDSLCIAQPIKLAKIDVEGHELSVLLGMEEILSRDHPVLIVEGDSDEVASYLASLGYGFEATAESPNRVYSWPG